MRNFRNRDKVLILLVCAVLSYVGWANADPPLSPPGGVVNNCSGEGTLASGTLQQNADCMAGFSRCAAVQASAVPATPGGVSYQCGPTVTVTGSPSPAATHTVVILNASTANATPVVDWYGVR